MTSAVSIDPATTYTRTHLCVVRRGIIPNRKHAYWVGYPNGSIGEDIMEGCLALIQILAIFVGQDYDNLKYALKSTWLPVSRPLPGEMLNSLLPFILNKWLPWSYYRLRKILYKGTLPASLLTTIAQQHWHNSVDACIPLFTIFWTLRINFHPTLWGVIACSLLITLRAPSKAFNSGSFGRLEWWQSLRKRIANGLRVLFIRPYWGRRVHRGYRECRH